MLKAWNSLEGRNSAVSTAGRREQLWVRRLTLHCYLILFILRISLWFWCVFQGCLEPKCKRTFHYPCGLKNGTGHQFRSFLFVYTSYSSSYSMVKRKMSWLIDELVWCLMNSWFIDWPSWLVNVYRHLKKKCGGRGALRHGSPVSILIPVF